jgi:hypothetical protein
VFDPAQRLIGIPALLNFILKKPVQRPGRGGIGPQRGFTPSEFDSMHLNAHGRLP